MISRRQLASYVVQSFERGENVIPQLAAYLIENRRTKEADLLVRDVEKLLEKNGVVVARVSSARSLDAAEITDIERVLKDRYDAKSVALKTCVDTSLLGGFQIRTAGDEFDGSLQRSINRLKALKA